MIQYSYENKKTDSHPTFIGRCYCSLLFSNHYWGLDFLACCPDPSWLTLVAQKSNSRTKNRDGRKMISSISVFLLFPPRNSLIEVNELWNSKESGTEVLASQLFLDCRARRSGWVGSTTLISSAFTALLNCAKVGRRNRILTNYRFLSHSLAVYWLCFQLL